MTDASVGIPVYGECPAGAGAPVAPSTEAKTGGVGPMPRVVDKQEKAERIGAAAIGVLRQLGYHRARMQDIAQAAGVGKGTLYEYFPNKGEIFRFEFERYFQAFEAGAERALAEAPSPGAKLLALVRFAFEHVNEWEDHCAVYVDYFGSARQEDDDTFSLGPVYGAIEARIRLLVESGQASGEVEVDVDPVATAELLVSIFDGVVLHGVFAKRSDTDALRDTALRLLEHGMITAHGPVPADEQGS
ncbi:MAG: TetR/AcrR family transcriptional regulator [bacterium]|nr:TetR/AcrR family transcriptional regulator [bacterium]